MVLEFFGPPGSGKSTLAKNLVKRDGNRFQIVHISSFYERMRYCLYFAFSHPISVVYWLSILVRNSYSLELFRYKFHLLSISMAKTMKAKMTDGEIKIIDEGLLQRGLSLFEDILDDNKIRVMISHIPVKCVYLVFSGGKFERFTTESDKENSPRFRRGSDYYEKWQRIVVQNSNTISAFLENSKYIEVMKVGQLTYWKNDELVKQIENFVNNAK